LITYYQCYRLLKPGDFFSFLISLSEGKKEYDVYHQSDKKGKKKKKVEPESTDNGATFSAT